MQRTRPAIAEFADKTATIAVVGLGKIGLPLAAQYIRHGRGVIGCDISPQVVRGINAGRSHVQEEPGLDEEVAAAVSTGRLRATDDTAQAVREARVIVVIVPVMVSDAHEVDFRAMDAASAAIGAGLGPGKLVIYETTLPVGTTSSRLRKALEEASGLTAGEDFLLAYSPERVSSGHIERDLRTYPKVVGGINKESTAAAEAFYRSVLGAPVMTMASTDDAEFVKLIETTYRDVNIALANEYARFADEHGLDLTSAVAAANTQPYSHIHTAGAGVGGHCIPVYPYFLMRGAGADGLTLPRRSRAINDGMAEYAADRVESEIGPLAGRAVLLMGIAYRGDVKEHAFSTARLLRTALERRGATVYAHDPLYDDREITALGYTPFRPELAGEIAAIVVQAAHSAYQTFDFTPFAECRVVLDGRRGLDSAAAAAVEAAGMRYLYIGDGRRAGDGAR